LMERRAPRNLASFDGNGPRNASVSETSASMSPPVAVDRRTPTTASGSRIDAAPKAPYGPPLRRTSAWNGIRHRPLTNRRPVADPSALGPDNKRRGPHTAIENATRRDSRSTQAPLWSAGPPPAGRSDLRHSANGFVVQASTVPRSCWSRRARTERRPPAGPAAVCPPSAFEFPRSLSASRDRLFFRLRQTKLPQNGSAFPRGRRTGPRGKAEEQSKSRQPKTVSAHDEDPSFSKAAIRGKSKW